MPGHSSDGQMNTLRAEYCSEKDSRPNEKANAVVAPLMAQFFIDSAEGYAP